MSSERQEKLEKQAVNEVRGRALMLPADIRDAMLKACDAVSALIEALLED